MTYIHMFLWRGGIGVGAGAGSRMAYIFHGKLSRFFHNETGIPVEYYVPAPREFPYVNYQESDQGEWENPVILQLGPQTEGLFIEATAYGLDRNNNKILQLADGLQVGSTQKFS